VMSWARNGHTFYAFRGTGWCWVYDSATKLWHERRSYLSDTWTVGALCAVGAKVFAGDGSSGKLYLLDASARSENGAPLQSWVTSAPVSDFPYRLGHKALHVEAVLGVGTLNTTDPKLMIDWTDDGEHYSTQLFRSLGAMGQTQGQIRAHRLGSAYTRTYRFGVSDAVDRMFISAKLDAERMGMT